MLAISRGKSVPYYDVRAAISPIWLTWRRQAWQGTLHALSPKKRGPRKQKPNPLSQKIAQLEKEKQRLTAKLKQAETIIEVQKKISEIMEIPLDHNAGENS